MRFIPILLLFVLSVVPYRIHAQENRINYSITVVDSEPAKLHVILNYTAETNRLYMAPGANQIDGRWTKFVENLSVQSLSGNEIPVKKNVDEWEIETDTPTPITLSYDLVLNHADFEWSSGIDGAAYQNEEGIFFTGRSLFILPELSSSEATLNFNLPDSWKITAPWVSESLKPVFHVENSDELALSMFFAGTHLERSIKNPEFEFVLAIGDSNLQQQSEEFYSMAEGIFDYYTKLMGGLPMLPASSKRLLIIINKGARTDGEVIGNHISMLIGKDDDPMSTMLSRFIYAHELFHLWNGKSFTPMDSESEWFKEGVTNYYTLKSLHHIGFLDDDTFLNVMNSLFYNRYVNDPGIGSIPLMNGDEKHDHWGVIYAGGMFAGIAQDLSIRQASNNTKSLDDALRKLFRQFPNTDTLYSSQSLFNLFAELHGTSQTPFIKQYITGSKPIPISRYLELAGFEASESNGLLRISIPDTLSCLELQIQRGFFGDLNNH